MIDGVHEPFLLPVETHVEAAEIGIYELPANATSTRDAVGKSVMSWPLDMCLRSLLAEAAPRTYFGAGGWGFWLLLLWLCRLMGTGLGA